MAASTQPLVSVVTPVHNGGPWLEECIRSVRAQSYPYFEYLIVNNGSTDRSLEIARSHAAEDERIRVLDNETFLGALQNFNHSMRQISAESRYCKVVHADDWLYPECLEKMVALAETHPRVGIVSSYRLVGSRVAGDGLPPGVAVLPGGEVARMNLLDGPYTFGTPSALLIRSDLIRARSNFYNELHSGADTEACLELLRECDFGFVHQVLSFCRLHEAAITGRQRLLGTGHPNFLYAFKKYGPYFLGEEEYRQRLHKLLRSYYRFLGSQLLHRPGSKFWDFHRQGFRNLGGTLEWPQVLLGAVRHLTGAAAAAPWRIKALVARGELEE